MTQGIPTLREQQIAEAGWALSRHAESMDKTMADLTDQAHTNNRRGWTIETTDARGNVLRSKGVVFTARELQEIVHFAACQRWQIAFGWRRPLPE